MNELPPDIATYVEKRLRHTVPAYLLLDGTGRVRGRGGDLARFGLGEVQDGRPADEQVPILQGLLPADGDTLILPGVQIDDDVSADVHLRDQWVLFFDATVEARRAQRLHQSVNDLAMMKREVTRLERRLDGRDASESDADPADLALLGGVFRARAVVVLRFRSDGMVDVVGDPPSWFRGAFPERSAFGRLNVWTRFPFLENFLTDAKAFWDEDGTGSIKSGMWYDTDEHGKEMHLEATATLAGDERVMLVELLGRQYEERQLLMQRAREGKLATERRIVEQKKAARQLQEARDELEERVAERTAQLTEVVDRLNAEIADRKQAAERLIHYQGRLRALAVELTRAEEEERRRIAQGLHDHMGQMLAVSKMMVASMKRAPENVDAEALEQLTAYLNEVIGYTRSLTFELGTPVLYDEGLEPALEDLVARMNGRHPDVQFVFEDDGESKPLAEPVRVILYQAVREVFHNAIKHADAKTITATTRRRRDFLELVIADDGRGFDAQGITSNRELMDRESSSGYGIFSIRERVDGIGGRMDIESTPGAGTTITLVAPVDAD